MLIRFAVSNLRSIHGRQELTMVPSAFYKGGNDFLIRVGENAPSSLLPVAVIYGPNAAGKSNLINAVRFLRGMVVGSQIHGNPEGGVPRQPFALNELGKATPSTVEIEFVLDGVRMQYGFEADDNAFTAEWLYKYPRRNRQMMFERTSASNIRFGRNLKGQNRVISELMRPNSLFLSAAAQNRHEQLSKVHSYISSMRFQAAGSDPTGPALHLIKKDYDSRIINFLTQIGTGIVGFRTKKLTPSEKQMELTQDLFALLKRHLDDETIEPPINTEDYVLELAHQSEKKVPVYFDAERESSGTRRLLLILSTVFSALDDGGIVFIDELDASLHTQVCEAIIALFSNQKRNPRGAQLIATTHDTNLMCSEHLRRDQLWFTEKDAAGATHLFPLSDIRTRNTDNIEKGYLQGRYGAIPFAGNLTDLLQE